jgi:large-conductance mechanosensitive channel
MGRNEIRLRRQRMSSGRIAQHRNYGDIMARHERDIKLRRISRIFIYFIIIAVLILLFMVVRKWENDTEPKAKPATASTQSASKDVWHSNI